jgi:CHAD domain-containing protein
VAALRIAGTEDEARRGDPGGIHRLRTTTRRLRSELRSLENLVEGRWRDQIEGELKWLAERLGAVRDIDILLARLKKGPGKRDRAGESALAPLFETLQDRRAQAAWSLNDALRSDRYRGLLASLEQAAEAPALLDAASEPCGVALPAVGSAAWRRLKKVGRSLRSSSSDEAFHEVRKSAKRARYTAELIAPVLSGRSARAAGRFIRLLTRAQDTLGEHQDAVVAVGELECSLAAAALDPGFVQAATALLESERARAHAARQAFFKVWDKLDRKKLRRWIKTKPKAAARA